MNTLFVKDLIFPRDLRVCSRFLKSLFKMFACYPLLYMLQEFAKRGNASHLLTEFILF